MKCDSCHRENIPEYAIHERILCGNCADDNPKADAEYCFACSGALKWKAFKKKLKAASAFLCRPAATAIFYAIIVAALISGFIWPAIVVKVLLGIVVLFGGLIVLASAGYIIVWKMLLVGIHRFGCIVCHHVLRLPNLADDNEPYAWLIGVASVAILPAIYLIGNAIFSLLATAH